MNAKLKQVAVFGAILITGVLFVGKFPVASQVTAATPNYGSLKQACVDDTVSVGACLALAAGLNQIRTGSTDAQPFFTATRRALNLTGKSTCDDCVHAAQDFEGLLVTNGTIQEIEQTMDRACASDFSDFSSQQACDSFVNANVPVIADKLVSNYPPLALCRNLSYCPVN